MLLAHFDTSEGKFTVELFETKAPKTVANFVGLAEGTREWIHPKTREKSTKPFYDGIIFHRIISGVMIQGGDPLGQGYGGPGYQFEDEFHPERSGHRLLLGIGDRLGHVVGDFAEVVLGVAAAVRKRDLPLSHGTAPSP